MYEHLDKAFVDPWMLLHGTEIIQSEAHSHVSVQIRMSSGRLILWQIFLQMLILRVL